MHLTYTTTASAKDIMNWSGTPYHMSRAFAAGGDTIHYVGNLKRELPFGFKLKQFIKKCSDQRESPRFNIYAAQHYSEQVAKQLQQHKTDAVISPLINPIAYLECKQPIILWTDALYASLLGFYPAFARHSANSVRAGNTLSEECLKRCRLAIFSSEWAARTAIEIYGAPHEKIKVVPYGANIESVYTFPDIQKIVSLRQRDCVKLLFIGKHWDRKGGDIVFRVAKALHAAGQKVEVHFVGCHPPKEIEIPSYIICHGFIPKRTPEGLEKITTLFRESHFLFLPSRAEACAIVFAEANAFALPVLTSYVGGITTAIKNNINGMTFSLDAPEKIYCDYIIDLMQNYSRYEALALSSFDQYQTRLNWRTATDHVRKLIRESI
ncbi:MAG: glycosyltransferase family 4 protein [Gammaproteobacteria bacterium]|nr:glycosyltransferase family 4 protein [Gammaproteobacteria bacterium]